MLRARVIPCLVIQNGNLIKTTKFRNPVYIGDPINAVKIFNEKNADEIIVLDIDATSKKKEPDYKLIKQLVRESRMPMCYGGGVKNLDQVKKIISFGIEKISLSSAAILDPNLIPSIVKEVGSQSTIVTLDIISNKDQNDFNIYINNGKTKTSITLYETLKNLEAAGTGEIIINSINLDGAMTGYDLDLAEKIYLKTRIPITILGGAGSLDDIKELFNRCKYIGAAAGSLFVFKGVYKAVLINYPSLEKKISLF